MNTTYYRADDYYDNSGNRVSQETYSKIDASPYLEYGLNQDWTIGAQFSFQNVWQNDVATGDLQSNAAMGDSEFFARYTAWREGNTVVSLRPFVKLPSPAATDNTLAIGSKYPDAGFGVAAGYSFTLYGLKSFADAELAYRYRYGAPSDQLHFNPTLGVHAADRWQALAQIFTTWRMDKSPTPLPFTNAAGNDYDLATTQLSVLYEYDTNYSLQAGLFHTLSGKNTGRGHGVVLSVWRNF